MFGFKGFCTCKPGGSWSSFAPVIQRSCNRKRLNRLVVWLVNDSGIFQFQFQLHLKLSILNLYMFSIEMIFLISCGISMLRGVHTQRYYCPHYCCLSKRIYEYNFRIFLAATFTHKCMLISLYIYGKLVRHCAKFNVLKIDFIVNSKILNLSVLL